jgi:hypothetical protein
MGIREYVTQIFRTRGQREQEQRLADQERDRARTPEEQISQREARRLAGMSAEDRAWEQASLERNRNAQDRSTS